MAANFRCEGGFAPAPDSASIRIVKNSSEICAAFPSQPGPLEIPAGIQHPVRKNQTFDGAIHRFVQDILQYDGVVHMGKTVNHVAISFAGM